MAVLLLLSCSAAFAQSGKLTIINTHPGCTVYIYAIATDPASFNAHPCDLSSCVIVVPPGSVSFPNPAAVASSPGFCSQTTTVPASYWGSYPSPANFTWTDVTFQVQCDGIGSACYGAVSEPGIMALSTCYGGAISSCMTWASTTPGLPLSNVTITY